MIVQINLLPEKVRAAEQLRKIIYAGVGAYALLLGVVGWRFVAAKANLAVVQAGIDEITAELNSEKLRRTVEEVERFTREKGELASKRSQVDVLRKRQATFVRLLDTLPDLVPPSVWIETMTQEDVKGERRFKLEGFAGTPEAVADFYTLLESHGLVKKPSLDDPPELAARLGRQVYRFMMSFSFEDFS